MILHGPYTAYVLIAYGVTALLALVMIWTSWRQWRQASDDWQQTAHDVAQDKSEGP
jgi:heme exporter protein CcmD